MGFFTPQIEKHRKFLSEHCDLSKIDKEMMGVNAYLAATAEAIWIVRLGSGLPGAIGGKMIKSYAWNKISSIEFRTDIFKTYVEIIPIGGEEANASGRGFIGAALNENVVLIKADKESKQLASSFTAFINNRLNSFNAVGIAGETKQCPYCAEIIKAAAKKCKHCGSML